MFTNHISLKARMIRYEKAKKIFTLDQINSKNPIQDELESYDYQPLSYDLFIPEKGYSYQLIELSKSRLFQLKKDDSNSDLLIYQVHGGGYITPFSGNTINNAYHYSRLFNDATIYSIDYTVAGVSPYPQALNDVVEGYQYLLSLTDAKNIIMVGNSAGAGLILSAGFKIRDMGLPMPLMMALGSPFTLLDQKGTYHRKNRKKDVVFGSKRKEAINELAIPMTYANDQNPMNEYISPGYGHFNGFPPMLIQVGSDEMLLGDSKIVYQKAKIDGVFIKLNIYKGLWHCFFTSEENFREKKLAWNEILKFYNCIQKKTR